MTEVEPRDLLGTWMRHWPTGSKNRLRHRNEQSPQW